MANEKLYAPATSFWLASPFAFADFANPTVAEFTAGLSGGWIVDITCALSQDGTEFNLDDPDTDDSLSFCQIAGAEEPTFDNINIVFEAFRSLDENDANSATTAFEWLAWADVPYIAIARVGEEPGTPVAIGQELKMATIRTDLPVDVYGEGENIRIQSTALFDGSINWNYTLAA